MSVTDESLPQRNDKQQTVRKRRRWTWLLAGLLLSWWALGFVTAFVATRPHPSPITERQRLGAHEVEVVEVAAADGVTARGWLVEVPAAESKCVILCAGIRGNRQRLVSRATFYHGLGWSTLLIDFRGTGVSDTARISMGWHEALDLLAWRALLQQRGYATVGVHGQSLGAAAAVYTSERTAKLQPWDFLVLEACYLDIGSALQARLFGLPEFLLWPVFVNAEWLLGVDAAKLSPLTAIAHHDAPTFFVCGALDNSVGHNATSRLMAASPAVDKVHYDVAGVAHKDLWRPGGAALRAALRAFLQRR